jgi:hypothetical protein
LEDRLRWKDNIKIDVNGIRWRDVNWINQDGQMAGCCEGGKEPPDFIKCGEWLG